MNQENICCSLAALMMQKKVDAVGKEMEIQII